MLYEGNITVCFVCHREPERRDDLLKLMLREIASSLTLLAMTHNFELMLESL